MDRKKTFLSHNSRDKPFVEQVAGWLEDEAKIPVWLDKWNLIPGDPWQEDMEKALDECQCCVVFIGPGEIGPWQKEEMRSAMDSRVSEKSLRVVPVLLPGVKRPGKESILPRFLRGLTWVEFKGKWDEPGALYRLECGIKGKEPGRDGDYGEIETGVCPFRGLEIFREQDRRFFYGREVLAEQLLDKLAHNRFLAVAGPSGSGKSSLVQAGLIYSLRPLSQVALCTPGEQPLEELAFALRACYPSWEKPPSEQLVERLQKGGNILHYLAREILEFSPQEKLLVVVDQFEELFTQTGGEEMRRGFISLLLEAVQVVNGPVTVILTIRSDFIGKCAFYKELNMFINDNFVQVEPMEKEELRRAIEKPAQMVGLHFEAGLVNRILEDVKGAPGELPLLEHALLELYERRQGGCLSLSAYDAVGGTAGALVNRADTEFNRLDDIEKKILRKMFVLRMIQPGEGTQDTCRRAAKKDLLAIGGDAPRVERVLDRWIKARLLTGTRDTSGRLVLVDVAHEALIRKWHKIREWMEEGREAARLTGILRQAVTEWLEKNRGPGFLFQGARLVQMEGLVKIHSGDLTEDEIEFVKAGAALRAAKERKELLAAQELADARARELKITRDLSTAKSITIKRTRIIIAVIFLSLMAVSYLLYNSNENKKEARINEKKARRQLAVNYWENSRQALEKGKLFYSFHL